MTSAMDDAVGVVLDKVRALGQENNTLIFFISDNGAPGHIDGNGILRGQKHTTWEGGIHLPFLMQWKGRLPAGKVYEHPVVQLDVMPTCVAAAGGAVDPAWKLDGVNLLPYLSGENSARPHQTLYWRIDGMWAIRHGDWKLVHGRAGNTAPELFDLAADIREQHDLAAEPAGQGPGAQDAVGRLERRTGPSAAGAGQGSQEGGQESREEGRKESRPGRGQLKRTLSGGILFDCDK